MSAERRTPERTWSNRSGRVGGSESSRPGGNDLPVNSSCTEIVACFRHTESSYSSSAVGSHAKGRAQTSTVGTVKNMITSCSSFRTGWRTKALAKRASPLLRFSMNRVSAAMWLPLTGLWSARQGGAGRLLHELTGNPLGRKQWQLPEGIALV